MPPRPLAVRFRRILILVFAAAFLGGAGLSVVDEYLASRDEYAGKMRSQVTIAQQMITDSILHYDTLSEQLTRQFPSARHDLWRDYLDEALVFLDKGDLAYLLDANQSIIYITWPYLAYEGMDLSHMPFFHAADKISPVMQSLFSNKSVISIKYLAPDGMTLVLERDIANVVKAMPYFEKGRIFPDQLMFVLTTEGTVAHHPDLQLVKSRHNLAFEMRRWRPPAAGELVTYELRGRKYFALREEFEVPRGWTIYFAVPASQLFEHISAVVTVLLLRLLFFFAVLYGILHLLLVRYFSQPVSAIVQQITAYQAGRNRKVLDERLAQGIEEFAAIVDSVNAMSADLELTGNELRINVERIRLLLNSTAEAIYGLDIHGNCTFCNNAFLTLMGYEREEQLVGRPMHEMIHHSHDDGRPYPVEECVAHAGFSLGKQAHADDEVFWRADGSAVEVEYWSYPIRKDNEILGAVVTFIDITRRRQAEKRLAEEKEQLAVTLRSIGDAVITTDIKGKVVLLNRVAEELTGWSQADARGRLLGEVFCAVDEQTRSPRANPAQQVIEQGMVVEMAGRTVLISRDGAERVVADRAAPIRDRKSRMVGVVLVFRDITERSIVEAERQKAQKLESVGVLAGGIAHDFNNILTAILGNIELAALMAASEKQRALLESAEKASLRARGLTRQLLTFAKGGEPVTETASIEEVIRDSASFVLHGSNVALTFAIPDDLWLVFIDKGQMSQVVQNIVLNAKNAMPSGGELSIACENYTVDETSALPLAPGHYVRVSIRDSGVGIAAHHLEKIFDPYFTTGELGHGLGLAVTRSIIEKHRGHITVDSRPGEGALFSIYLPVAEQQGRRPPAPPVKKHAPTGARILVMDDEKIVRDVAQQMLQTLGYQVFAAEDGKQMLALYARLRSEGSPVDLVIMDLTIPGGMGGREAMADLLLLDSRARAIVASGYSNDPAMADCKAHGFRAAVAKPFQLDELRDAIERVLGREK